MQYIFFALSQSFLRLAVLIFSLLMGGLVTGCKRDEKFPDIGLTLASPTDVAADKSGAYFYVLNADYPRDYNVGSIVTFNSSGDKLGAIQVPRLGRSLTRSGDDLFATFSSRGDEGGPVVQLYDLSKPEAPVMVKQWEVNVVCNPINTVARENYKYFAVACANGMLLAGELKTPRTESTLTLVRNYPFARRAMHINVARNLLIAFPTDLSEQTWADSMQVDKDSVSDDDTGTVTENTPDDVADDWQKDIPSRRNKDKRSPYQYIVYDFAAEAAKGFPYLEGTTNVQPELHFVYFNLLNFDGTPDFVLKNDSATSLYSKYYRTNFWQAQPDPNSDDIFYLSHRGYTTTTRNGSPHANNIVKVTLTGDLKAKGYKTKDVMNFERVYGFKGELDPSGRYYPMGFQIQQVRGQPLLLVNNFRDLINFPNQYYFSLAAKVLGSNAWFTEKSTTDVGHSYYQVALTASGRGMAISFYGNVAILLDAFPGTDINELKTIN